MELSKKFTGWANVGLTEKGKHQAKESGKIILKNNIIPKVTFTSTLIRSIDTNKIIIEEVGKNIPTITNWRLNEKHYGKLTGYRRDIDYKWSGGYFDIPPLINSFKEIDLLYNKEYSPDYGESYYMTFLRIYPLWKQIIPKIINNDNPLICAHKNSIKVLIQHIEKINIENINEIDVPNAKPIVYYFDDNMNFISKKFLK